MVKYLGEIKDILTKSDIILIIGLLLFSIFLLITFKLKKNNKILEISYQNEILGEYNLNQNRVIEIKKGLVVEIKNGEYRVKQSDCENQICVKQGWNDTFPVICVPNQLSLQIKNNKEKIIMTY